MTKIIGQLFFNAFLFVDNMVLKKNPRALTTKKSEVQVSKEAFSGMVIESIEFLDDRNYINSAISRLMPIRFYLLCS